MKFTDKFFKFPVKTYDIYDVVNAEEREAREMEHTGELNKVDLNPGVIIKAIKHKDIIDYNEGCGREDNLQEAMANGFPSTYVTTINGTYECIWPMKKFEDKLNAFVEKYEANQEKKL